MNRTPSLFRLAGLLLALSFSFTACESLQFSMLKDPDLVKGGVQAWNADRITSAKGYWNAIRDPELRSQWLGRIDQYYQLDKTFADAVALPPTPEAPLLAAWKDSWAAWNAFPPELQLSNAYLDNLVTLARTIVQGRIDDGRIPAAKEFMKTASDLLGSRIEWSAELQSIQDYEKNQAIANSYKALDRSLDKSTSDVLAAARGQDDFDAKIAGYEGAIVAFTKAEATLAAQAKANGYKENSALGRMPDKYKKGRADTRTEMERTLRERATSFKERIGEEFARTPEGDALGTMGPEDILRFYEQTKTNVEAMQAEVVAFAGKYPKIIDKDMLKDVEDQKQALEARIVQVTAEVRKAQADAKVAAEIASRGKAVLPLLIGLFNPQPGTKGNDSKSRPAKFRGTLTGDAVYWWGMADIVPGTLNDLVITVNDNRPVRVFSDNTLSGKAIADKKLKDLVNRQYKVGNSWPVLNAGAQLPSGRYFFEVGKAKDAKYSGDVVVYSSFIVRMR